MPTVNKATSAKETVAALGSERCAPGEVTKTVLRVLCAKRRDNVPTASTHLGFWHARSAKTPIANEAFCATTKVGAKLHCLKWARSKAVRLAQTNIVNKARSASQVGLVRWESTLLVCLADKAYVASGRVFAQGRAHGALLRPTRIVSPALIARNKASVRLPRGDACPPPRHTVYKVRLASKMVVVLCKVSAVFHPNSLTA